MPPPYPPPRLRLAVLLADVPGYLAPKIASKSIKKIITFLNRFLIRFGTHFGAMLAPFLLHFWSQIALGHSSLSKTWIFTKTFKNQ